MIPRLGGANNGTSKPESATAHSLARQLLGRGAARAMEAPPAGEAMQQAFSRVSENLRRSLGEDGYRALLGRAVGRIQADQPVWTSIRFTGLAVDLDVIAAVDRHGASIVAAALESLVAALFDILSDLIGAEMARNLLEYDGPRATLAGDES